jgi:hypothetical protein
VDYSADHQNMTNKIKAMLQEKLFKERDNGKEGFS